MPLHCLVSSRFSCTACHTIADPIADPIADLAINDSSTGLTCARWGRGEALGRLRELPSWLLNSIITTFVYFPFLSCRGGCRDCAHLCPGNGLHRSILAPVGKATPGSLLPRLRPPGSQESLEAGCSHRHLAPCALHACDQPLHAHRSDPQSPPATLCCAHARLEMLQSALLVLMFLKAMLHLQFTA